MRKALIYFKDYGILEEKKVEERTADQDSIVFDETILKMKDILWKTYEAKQSSIGSKKPSEALLEMKKDFLMQFMTLKKLNRLDKLRSKSGREATTEVKANVDNFHLQLQNLLYEVLHLQKEVDKCIQYKSLDESIELVSLNEFYGNAPTEISVPSETRTNSHKQRLARLEYEKRQREGQRQQIRKLELEEQALESHIAKKRHSLDSLKPQLTTILTATEPVQKFLNMPINRERDQLELAKYLPPPLFVVFSETRAYAQACGKYLILHTVLIKINCPGYNIHMY